MSERRRFPRKKEHFLVFYFSKKGLKGGLGRTIDISKKGVMLELSESLKPSEPIELNIALGEKIFHLKGKVVWTKEEEGFTLAGVSFEDSELPIDI